MAARHIAQSTGYETLAYAGMSATQGKQATRFDIYSDEEMTGQHSAADKQHPLDGGASSTNERPDGTGSRPLAAVASGASRNRSRSSRTNSKGVSSEEDMQAAKQVSRDQQKIPLGSGSETLPSCPAGKLRISSAIRECQGVLLGHKHHRKYKLTREYLCRNL